MLALPVFASLGGFLPTIVIYFFCWVFMVSTGLLLLEVSLWNKGETNMISMATDTLGKKGRYATWLLYAFLFYSLNVAYIAEGGQRMIALFGIEQLTTFAPLFFLLLFAPIIFIGPFAVDKANELLMGGLIISFLAFVFWGVGHVDVDRLSHIDWSWSLLSMPIAITSFGFHNIVPTLTTYMDHDVKKIKKAIIIGASLPFFIYVVWNWLVLGIVPLTGGGGLAEAMTSGSSAVKPLLGVLQNKNIIVASTIFAFCAVLTSFLGVSLAFMDFIADGLSIKKTPKGKTIIGLLVFVPPIIIATTYPGIFLQALKHGGGFGGILLLGLLPIMMVWVGRKKYSDAPYKFCGGKPLLAIMTIFVIIELIVDFLY